MVEGLMMWLPQLFSLSHDDSAHAHRHAQTQHRERGYLTFGQWSVQIGRNFA